MKTHFVKIESVYFERILDGTKPFEIRFNDRGYQMGDKIVLMECEQLCTATDLTGREAAATIGFCTSYGQKENYVVFGLLNIKETVK